MDQEIKWIRTIAPDMVKTMEQRFSILRNIEWSAPIGRRSLAQNLNISERVLRTETDFLRKQDLITATRSGMVLTAKGKQTIQGLALFMDGLSGIHQLEKKLGEKLGIKHCYIVPGNSDNQVKVVDAMGKVVNNVLRELLPKGQNVIAAMGGSTMARVAQQLTPELAVDRDLTFVPARGGIGERIDIQANNVSAQMALHTGGKHRALYVPEHVSENTYQPLLAEPSVRQVVDLIRHSNAAIHSIGEAIKMAERRAMPAKVIQMLAEKQAVGEAFGYFFDEEGKIIYKIPRIGLQLEDLTSMDCVLAVAGGASKAKAIMAYVRIAPPNMCLITDEGAAKVILN